jgi:hypothetical protein
MNTPHCRCQGRRKLGLGMGRGGPGVTAIGVGSNSAWDLFGGAGYRSKPKHSVTIGYRSSIRGPSRWQSPFRYRAVGPGGVRLALPKSSSPQAPTSPVRVGLTTSCRRRKNTALPRAGHILETQGARDR